jgi:hypothetical protein
MENGILQTLPGEEAKILTALMDFIYPMEKKST